MYTEIELSEFIIRARLKLGDMSEEIFEYAKVGDDIDDLLKEFSALKLFLNSLNSTYQKWSQRDLYKRTEDIAYRYKLMNAPYFDTDWLDEFKPIPTYYGSIAGNTPIQIPDGSGILYAENGQLFLFKDDQLTLGDL